MIRNYLRNKTTTIALYEQNSKMFAMWNFKLTYDLNKLANFILLWPIMPIICFILNIIYRGSRNYKIKKLAMMSIVMKEIL